MPTNPNVMPPKHPGGNGQVKPMPSGPSKKVRDDYLRKVREITRNTPQPPKKPSGG